MTGPINPVCDRVHAEKYRQENESFDEAIGRMASAISDSEEHHVTVKEILRDMRFMPAGRIQSSMGSARESTPLNCFVSGVIEDSMDSIMWRLWNAAETMRKGGGLGFDFSRLRPSGDRIISLDTSGSGPVSFMEVYDALCNTIRAAGHRRGAMMGVLRVDHPDIEKFIRAKQKDGMLTNFNISIGITDEFMRAVDTGGQFSLRFGGRVYKNVDAMALWNEIMRATWDWAEPGVLFLDTINRKNNLAYIERIEATNPCGEQPLPPNGACLLGSFNLVKYIGRYPNKDETFWFDYEQFKHDIPPIIRAMDNIIDVASFPLKEQEDEAKNKRRIGVGITGLGSTLCILGIKYGSVEARDFTNVLLSTLTNTAYRTSVSLAIEKGPFPVFDKNKFRLSLAPVLEEDLINDVFKYGLRNSHLISIAPTGTISFCADNISSGMEPILAHTVDRTILTKTDVEIVRVKDYAYETYDIKGTTVDDLSIDDHLNMLITAIPYVDSAISKTVNVGDSVHFDDFKDIYMKAWKGGAKGLTTFRASGKRFGPIQKVDEGAACFINPDTMQRSCDE
tara:strand:- start:4895 stop:6586 length:1692 start_codon:yes stop_codon:yes gene_type:complete